MGDPSSLPHTANLLQGLGNVTVSKTFLFFCEFIVSQYSAVQYHVN